MKIPQTLIVDGLVWQVDVTDVTLEEYGETRPEHCHVVIGSRYPRQLQEQAFWHEMIHVLFASRDFSLPKKFCEDMDELEELIARFLGPALRSFLVANAEPIRWKEHDEEPETGRVCSHGETKADH